MGTRTRVHWNGTVNFTYEEQGLVATVEAHADHWYQPGRKYLANGDPGYPTEDEIEDIDFEVTALRDAETDEEVEYTEDMCNAVEDAIGDQAEWEEPDPDEDGPDYDYYEEREMARWEAECDRCGL